MNELTPSLLLDHTYLVLPLQKLIHLHQDSDCESESWESGEDLSLEKRKARKRKKKGEISMMSRLMNSINGIDERDMPPQPVKTTTASGNPSNGFATSYNGTTPPEPRTLQRYHGGPNEERTVYMETHSALASKNLAVSVEQVSIFLTADNTVVSYVPQVS